MRGWKGKGFKQKALRLLDKSYGPSVRARQLCAKTRVFAVVGSRLISGCIIKAEMRIRSSSLFLALLACAAPVIATIGCKSLPPSKPASEWSPEEAHGAAVFQQACANENDPSHGLISFKPGRPGNVGKRKVVLSPFEIGIPPRFSRWSVMAPEGLAVLSLAGCCPKIAG